jgi:esterase
MAGDIAETLKHLNISRAVLIGHSIGGRVAMELALSMPDSVEKLIVEDLPPMVVPAPLIAGILSAMLNLDFTQVKNSNDADDMLRESIPVSVLINIQSIFIITTLHCNKSYLLLLQ